MLGSTVSGVCLCVCIMCVCIMCVCVYACTVCVCLCAYGVFVCVSMCMSVHMVCVRVCVCKVCVRESVAGVLSLHQGSQDGSEGSGALW